MDPEGVNKEPQIELRPVSLDAAAEYYAVYLVANRDQPGNRDLPKVLPDAKAIRMNLLGQLGKEFWGIYDENKTLIGMITLTPEVGTQSTAEIGYDVDKKYNKRGFATSAVKQLIRDRSQRYNIFIATGVLPDNEGSKRVLEKAGFKLMGENRDGHLFYKYSVSSEAVRT